MVLVSIGQEKAEHLISDISLYVLLNMGMLFWSMPNNHKPKGYVSHRPRGIYNG